MTTSNKILLNTLFLYVQLGITSLVSLVLVRYVLKYMGIEDFGLYSLIGGVVAMLGFLNGSLMISTQRYLSISLGQQNINRIHNIFSASKWIHLGMSFCIFLILEVSEPLLIGNILNIDASRIYAAKIIYQLMVISLVITMNTVPYSAAFIAHEDIWLDASIGVISSCVKLCAILFFGKVNFDTLIFYCSWLLGIVLFEFIVKCVFCRIRYKEISHWMSLRKSKKSIKEMLSFVGWNTVGNLAIIGRNQGSNLVLNIFFGTGVNAAFAIANQINAFLFNLSNMFTKAMEPKLMQNCGNNNVQHAIKIAMISNKISFLCSVIISIPLTIKFSFILDFWLQNPPKDAYIYCTLMLVVFLIMQLYPGLVRLIYGMGDIKKYQLICSLLLLTPLPVSIVMFSNDMNPYAILYAQIAAQILTMLFTVEVCVKRAPINRTKYMIYILKCVLLFCCSFSCSFLMNYICSYGWVSVINVSLINFIISSIFFYFIILESHEKNAIRSKFFQGVKKIKIYL